MGFLNFLFPPPIHDEVVGTLRRTWSGWRGDIDLQEGDPVPLLIAGSRAGPSQAALDLAHQLPGRYPSLKPAIGVALLEHAEPARDDLPVGLPMPPANNPETVWRSVIPVHVRVEPIDGTLMIEIGLSADWDEEHTLGARLRDWRLVELNGSVRGV